MNDNIIIENLAAYIDEHLAEDLSLDRLSAECNYSKFYIARIFAEKTGCTIHQYIRGRRLTLAAEKLARTDEPIVEIAYEAHYNSQQAFTLAFSRLYQCTPQTYRKNGVFYPKQPRIRLSAKPYFSDTNSMKGGRMAA